MGDELDRLRDVARAAAAMVRAQAAYQAHGAQLRDRPADFSITHELGDTHRLATAARAGEEQLIAALARLGQVAPDLLIPPA
jgi:hypothetical protein